MYTGYLYSTHPTSVYAVGPTEETVVKFWQMVWEYQLTTIVMLTRCVEDSRVSLLYSHFLNTAIYHGMYLLQM